MQVQGVVEKTDILNTRTGKTVWSIYVNGQKYGGMWEDPQLFSGDTVSFDAVQQGQYWNVGRNTMQKTGSGGGVAPAASAPQAGGGGTTPRDVSIMYQSSRKDAIKLLPELFAQEAITFPKSMKPSEKYDTILAIVDELTASNYVKITDAIAKGGVYVEDMLPEPGA